MRIPTIIIISLLLAVCASAAPMVRVTGIKDGRTLILDGGAELRLAGVEITNEAFARELLRWTVGTAWILVERRADGTALVYRSPDAMFVNRELVARGYARATLPGIESEERIAATYLGVVDPGPRTPPAASAAASRTGSGKSARSTAPRASRPARSPTPGRRRR